MSGKTYIVKSYEDTTIYGVALSLEAAQQWADNEAMTEWEFTYPQKIKWQAREWEHDEYHGWIKAQDSSGFVITEVDLLG